MDLKSTQLKDTYGNLLTIGTSAGSPQTGTLQNGDGEDITALNVAGTITGVTLAGTLSTAAQTNITSVGTLTSLSSTGNINADDYSVGSWKTIDWTGSLLKFGGIDAANWTAISLHTSGSEKVRIDTIGNVGIGTTSPSGKLTVNGASTPSSTPSGTFQITNLGGGTPTQINMGVQDSSPFYGWIQTQHQTLSGFYYSLLLNPQGGNVGIGTNTPSEKLEVQDGSISVGSSTNTSTTNALLSGYGYILSGTKLGNTSIKSTYNNSNNSASLEFYTDPNGSTPTERMRIDSSGNVGISSISPDATLTLGSNSVTGDTMRIKMHRGGSTSQYTELKYAGNFVVNGSGNDLVMQREGSEVARFTSDGLCFGGDFATVNALDDYEEGTFDLTLKGSTSDPTTPVVTTARYTKIGNVVHYNIRFDNVDTTGASGNVTFSGFPFTTTSTNHAAGSVSLYSMADFNGSEYIDLYIGTSSTLGELLGSRTNNFWVSPQHNAGSGRYLQASITVHVV